MYYFDPFSKNNEGICVTYYLKVTKFFFESFFSFGKDGLFFYLYCCDVSLFFMGLLL